MNNNDFEMRLQRLERQVKGYRLASVVLGLGLIGLAGIAANAPTPPVSQELRTHKLSIVDERGKEAARLFAGPHGGMLDILSYDNLEAPIVRAGAGEKGGKLVLSNGQGQDFVELISAEAGGQVNIADKQGKKNLMRAVPGRAEK